MVQRAAERIDVAADIGGMRMPRLLRGDVVEGADGGSFARDAILLGQVDRQSQVGQLGGPVTGDQDVVRVDVAMDQSFAVGVLQPHGDLPDQPAPRSPAESRPVRKSTWPIVLPSIYSITRKNRPLDSPKS